MPLIKNGSVVEDLWISLEDGEEVPNGGDVILSLEQLQATKGLSTRQGRTGVTLPNTAQIRALNDIFPGLDLVALHFPAFTDGRAYSQSWQLRHDIGFRGEIRATGNVLVDQATFLARAGFDAFMVEEGPSLESWKRGLAAITHAYQPGYGESAARLRRCVPA